MSVLCRRLCWAAQQMVNQAASLSQEIGELQAALCDETERRRNAERTCGALESSLDHLARQLPSKLQATVRGHTQSGNASTHHGGKCTKWAGHGRARQFYRRVPRSELAVAECVCVGVTVTGTWWTDTSRRSGDDDAALLEANSRHFASMVEVRAMPELAVAAPVRALLVILGSGDTLTCSAGTGSGGGGLATGVLAYR